MIFLECIPCLLYTSDSGQVQHTVGTASQGHINGKGVEESILYHNIPGFDIFFYQFHDLHASVFRQAQALGIYSGNGTIARPVSYTHLVNPTEYEKYQFFGGNDGKIQPYRNGNRRGRL